MALRLFFHLLQMAEGGVFVPRGWEPPVPYGCQVSMAREGHPAHRLPGGRSYLPGPHVQGCLSSHLKPSFNQSIAVGLRHAVAAAAGRFLQQ